MRVVGCFLEYNDTFVLLRRPSHKPDGDSWGLPAGKVEADEQTIALLFASFSKKLATKLILNN